MPDTKRWIITGSGDVPMTDLKKQLTATGFNIEQELNEINIFTGTAGEDAAERIKTIPGVVDISPDTNIDIGPPDAPITW